MGYLVISRKINERIGIGSEIEIFVSDIRTYPDGRQTVDIAIDAPKSLEIVRKPTHMKEQKDGTSHRNKSR